MPPSGKVMDSGPLSLVNATMVLSSWPMSSSFLRTSRLNVAGSELGVLVELLATFGKTEIVPRARQDKFTLVATKHQPELERYPVGVSWLQGGRTRGGSEDQWRTADRRFHQHRTLSDISEGAQFYRRCSHF